MNVLQLAWRNVWRNTRRSAITISAMSLALGTALVYSGLVDGMLVDMARDVTEMDSGDVQVFSKGWLDRPSLHETVDSAAILGVLHGAGYPATARLQAGGLAASGELSAGVSLVGLDPTQDRAVLSVHEAVEKGSWLDPAEPRGVVVGRGLARTLALDVGSELVVLSQGLDGSMANELFTVRGVLGSVASGTDRGTVFVNEGTFRTLMVFPEGAHRVIVKAPPGVSVEAAGERLRALLPGEQVKTWKELNPLVAQMLDAVQVQVAVIYFIFYVAVAILVVNAMLMAVFERIREFGVLKAIGYGPGAVFTMMVAEGLIQAAVASVGGALLAAPFMYWFSTSGLDVGALGGVDVMGMAMPAVWKGVYTVSAAKDPVIMLFGIVLLAMLYPAAKAAWIQPVEAMHHQ